MLAHNHHSPIIHILVTRWHEDQKLGLEMMIFCHQLQEGICEKLPTSL